MHELTARLRPENGIALPVAMITMMVIGTLSAVLLATAMQAANSGVSDANQKSASQIASAGVQAAVYRVNAQAAGSVPAADCFTTAAVAPSGGLCPGQTDAYGNGSYTYWVSPVLTQSDPCTGYWVQNAGQPVAQRCVTATGTVNGQTSRVEERVVTFAQFNPTPVTFPVNGILGITGINLLGNGGVVAGDAASNHDIKLTGAWSVGGTVYYADPNNPPHQPTCKKNTCVQVPAYSIPAVDPNTYGATAQANSDDVIQWPAGVTYDPVGRTATGTAATPVVLPTGTYSFCNLSITGTIQVPAGASVVIYLDSPYRPGSTCAAGTGNASLGPEVDNVSADPSKLVIESYGDPSGAQQGTPATTISLDHTGGGGGSPSLYGDVYAPNSTVNFGHQLNMTGQLLAAAVGSTTQVTFTAGGSQTVGGGAGTPTASTYFPSAWHLCPRSFSGDPRSGCS